MTINRVPTGKELEEAYWQDAKAVEEDEAEARERSERRDREQEAHQ